jgi:hypothetical protein
MIIFSADCFKNSLTFITYATDQKFPCASNDFLHLKNNQDQGLLRLDVSCRRNSVQTKIHFVPINIIYYEAMKFMAKISKTINK